MTEFFPSPFSRPLLTFADFAARHQDVSQGLWEDPTPCMFTVRVKIITGSLVILENVFSQTYRYRYRLEIRMNFHYRYRLGVRSHPFISIDSQLPS